MPSRILLLALALFLGSCREMLTNSNRIVVLQPLGDFPPEDAARIQTALHRSFPNVLLRDAIPLPATAFYPARARYRADSLLKILARRGSRDTVVAGLLREDISTTKGAHADWGVMGLGYRPGNACVISSFRLNKNARAEQFYKVVIHELGHTQGLPHCPEKTCFMRDAEGGNPLDDEYHFCNSCSAFLKRKGWKLP